MLGELLESVVVDPDVARAVDALPDTPTGFDPWGFSAEHCKWYYSLARHAYRYFRPKIEGIEKLPPGRCLLVPNHSGQLPFDGLVVALAMLLHEARRLPHWDAST